MARPSDYSPETAEAICQAIAEGKSLRSICRQADQPGLSTVMRWLGQHSAFREQYTRAGELRLEAFAEDIVEIGEKVAEAVYTDEDGNQRVDTGAVQAARLQADNLKWLMSKLAPRKYGDRIEHIVKATRVEDMTDEELARIAGTALLITSQVTQDETPPEYPGNKGGGGGTDG